MEKVTYFDVEYANSKNRSICQMGILCENYVDEEPYYPEKNIYVNPEDNFDDVCIRVHGITSGKVKDAPSFKETWNDIEKYFTNTVVIGHNVASSDLDALVKALKRYKLDIPEIYYVCTLELAKEFVPRFAIKDYSLSSLCEFFDIDMDSEHDAFDDACANADLLKTLVKEYSINIDAYVKKYDIQETKEFSAFVSDSVLRKSVSEFYGVVKGISIDDKINIKEMDYIYQWKKEHETYKNYREFYGILKVLDKVFDDGWITMDELAEIQEHVKKYLDVVSTAPVTLATQVLDGILKGIAVDKVITEDEAGNLRQWLYDNCYLAGHYPFDKVLSLLDSALEDLVITKEESEYIVSVIEQLLNPVDALKEQIHSVEGKNICLSGVFSKGSKSEVEQYIKERGGSIDSNVKKTTNILLIGNLECQAYSNGTYGTKVKKAIEYNEKGCNIQIVKESDFFDNV